MGQSGDMPLSVETNSVVLPVIVGVVGAALVLLVVALSWKLRRTQTMKQFENQSQNNLWTSGNSMNILL